MLGDESRAFCFSDCIGVDFALRRFTLYIHAGGEEMIDSPKPDDNQIKLYTLLVDQIQKYNSIIWQVPTALIAANFFAIDKFISYPPLLLALALFNAVLIYAFYRMVIQQRAIIDAARQSEAELKKTYNAFIPSFSVTKIRAPRLFVYTLSLLDACLFAFGMYRLFTPQP